MNKTKNLDAVMRVLLTDSSALDLSAPETAASLDVLAAGGYAELTKAWGGEILRAVPTDLGCRYFEIKAQRRREKRKAWWGGFFCGVLSSLTAAAIAAGGAKILGWLSFL